MNILILFASNDGQTKKIADFIKDTIEKKLIIALPQVIIDCHDIAQYADFLEKKYDFVIIGSRIRYGHHHKKIIRWIKLNQKKLSIIPWAFFSVSLLARKPVKATAKNNPYIKKLFRRFPITPDLIGVFAGRLCYQKYHGINKLMILLIMKLTQGPTRLDTDIEFTDWVSVKKFTDEIINICNKSQLF